VPTHLPTNAPTNAPTDRPTTAPSNAPTHRPTNAPTKAPVPTAAPTRHPTDAPAPGYNCFTREAWSEQKRAWCCASVGTGCRPGETSSGGGSPEAGDDGAAPTPAPTPAPAYCVPGHWMTVPWDRAPYTCRQLCGCERCVSPSGRNAYGAWRCDRPTRDAVSVLVPPPAPIVPFVGGRHREMLLPGSGIPGGWERRHRRHRRRRLLAAAGASTALVQISTSGNQGAIGSAAAAGASTAQFASAAGSASGAGSAGAAAAAGGGAGAATGSVAAAVGCVAAVGLVAAVGIAMKKRRDGQIIQNGAGSKRTIIQKASVQGVDDQTDVL